MQLVRRDVPWLRFELDILLARPLDTEAGTAFIRSAVRSLHDHELGPATWIARRGIAEPGRELPIDDLGWTGFAVLGTWRERQVELELLIGAARVHFAVHWEWHSDLALIDGLVTWTLEALRLAGPGARIAGASKLEPRMDLLHRAPRASSFGALLEILDTASHDGKLPDGYERMLPGGARRQVAGSIHALQWAKDPLTNDEIQRAVLAHERWLAKRPDATPSDDWNEHGDLWRKTRYQPHPPLERYCEDSAVGFIEVAHDVDDARLDEIAAWRTRGALPDGSPITKLDALCSSRRIAIALRQRLQTRGLGATYYDRVIWDPFPEGYVRDVPDPVSPHLALDLACELPQENSAFVQLIPRLLDERGIGAAHWRVLSDTSDQLGELDAIEWPTLEIELVAEPHEPSIRMLARGTLLQACVRWPWRDEMHLIAPLIEAIAAIGRALPEGGYIVETNSLVPVGLPLRSLAPPRERLCSKYGSLLDVVDTADDGWRNYARLLEGFKDEPPPSAVRHEDGTIRALQWARDPLSLDELQRAWTAQQRWLTGMGAEIATPPGEVPRWNELGDLRVRGYLESVPPLTLFDDESSAGYKAVYAESDGIVDEEDIAEMASLLGEGALPDGTPIASITLVCPTRDAALAIESCARSHRLGVAYARGDHEVWIVHPEGWEHSA